MNFQEFIDKNVQSKLSEVKLKILNSLWNCGTEFPRGWVRSSVLLGITQQKYFDRRTRELRDQLGFDIETKYLDGEHQYRLVSDNVKIANPRFYLSESKKTALFTREKYTCQICGRVAQSGVRGLQADHKVPLSRDGSQTDDNWQSVCNECNVAKRRSCQDCVEDCYVCHWAFPEKVGFPVTIFLPRDLFDKYEESVKSNRDWLTDIIRKG